MCGVYTYGWLIVLVSPAIGGTDGPLHVPSTYIHISPQIMGVLEHFKKEGHNPLASGFRLKPIFEELPSDTDSKMGYSTIK